MGDGCRRWEQYIPSIVIMPQNPRATPVGIDLGIDLLPKFEVRSPPI